VTMPIVNVTLFQQAGIAMPGAHATWQEWATATKAVAQKLSVPIPIAIDRSGHRISGPAICMGAKFFDGDTPELTDDGFKAAMKMIYGLAPGRRDVEADLGLGRRRLLSRVPMRSSPTVRWCSI